MLITSFLLVVFNTILLDFISKALVNHVYLTTLLFEQLIVIKILIILIFSYE